MNSFRDGSKRREIATRYTLHTHTQVRDTTVISVSSSRRVGEYAARATPMVMASRAALISRQIPNGNYRLTYGKYRERARARARGAATVAYDREVSEVLGWARQGDDTAGMTPYLDVRRYYMTLL